MILKYMGYFIILKFNHFQINHNRNETSKIHIFYRIFGGRDFERHPRTWINIWYLVPLLRTCILCYRSSLIMIIVDIFFKNGELHFCI